MDLYTPVAAIRPDKKGEFPMAVRFIGKCSACKLVSARDYNETQKRRNDYGRVVTTFGRSLSGIFVRASADICCPSCGNPGWNGKRIEGFITDHPCDDRCTEAKGHKCQCSCGGKNHGQSFICEGIAA